MPEPASFVSRTPKAQYSEKEAAEELGLSVEQFRTLIRSHIVDSEEDLNNVPAASYHPSDLLVLKILASSKAGSTLPG